MVVKINISVSEDVLKKIDQAAREEKTTRSAFMTRAVNHFLEEKRAEKERERRRQAARDIDSIRKQAEPWDAAAEVIKWRDLH